jgi:hypothetical protein
MVQGTSAGDAPTAEQLTSLLGLIEKQKGQAISEVQGQDWVWYLTEVVFRGESGYVRTLMQFGPETSSLVARIEGLVTGLQNKELPKTDLVHGDMAINQILFAGRDVSAVLDWDQVGYGDRTIDLVSLWYSLVERNDAQRQVLEHIMTVSEPEIIKIYAVYKMLTSVAGQITKAGGDLPAAVARANAALAVLDSLPKPEPAASAPGATPAAMAPEPIPASAPPPAADPVPISEPVPAPQPVADVATTTPAIDTLSAPESTPDTSISNVTVDSAGNVAETPPPAPPQPTPALPPAPPVIPAPAPEPSAPEPPITAPPGPQAPVIPPTPPVPPAPPISPPS